MRVLKKILAIALLTAAAVGAEVLIFNIGNNKIGCNYGSGYSYGCGQADYQIMIIVAVFYIALTALIVGK